MIFMIPLNLDQVGGTSAGFVCYGVRTLAHKVKTRRMKQQHYKSPIDSALEAKKAKGGKLVRWP